MKPVPVTRTQAASTGTTAAVPRLDAVSTSWSAARQGASPPNERMKRATQCVNSPQARLSGLDRSP